MPWYQIFPRLGIKLNIKELVKTLDPALILVFLKTGDEKLKLYLHTETSKESLSPFFDAIDDHPHIDPSPPDDIDSEGKIFVSIAKPLIHKDFYLHDFSISDLPGLAQVLPTNTLVAVAINRDPRLKRKLLYRYQAFRSQEIKARAKTMRGQYGFVPLFLEPLQQKLRDTPLMAAVYVATNSRDKRKYVEELIKARSRPELSWRRKRFKEFDLSVIQYPNISLADIFLKEWLRPGLPKLSTCFSSVVDWLTLPNPSTHDVAFVRGENLPKQIAEREGFRIGQLEDGRTVFLSPEDFFRHAYLIGQTGTGKTTLLKLLAKELKRFGKGTVVVIDPHGDMATELAMEVEDSVYLHPIDSPFGINPLDLPRGIERDHAITISVDILLNLFTNILKLTEYAVNVRYLLQVIIRRLYTKTDHPTLGLLYYAILTLYNGGDLGIDDEKFHEHLKLIRNFPEQSFISALARLEPFFDDVVVRRVTSKTTIPIHDFLKPGKMIIFSLPKAAIGENVSSLLASSILLKIWYEVLIRARKGQERTPVYVIVDEFQVLQSLPILETILSEARKYGLHLILAHQYPRQLTPELLQAVFANSGVKFLFNFSEDLSLFESLDPALSKEVIGTIPTLPVGHALMKVTTKPEEVGFPPVVVSVDWHPPKFVRKDITVQDYAPEDVEVGLELINPLLRYIEPPNTVDIRIIHYVYRETVIGKYGALSKDAKVAARDIINTIPIRRDIIDRRLAHLVNKKYIEITREGKNRYVRLREEFFEEFYKSAPSEKGRRLVDVALDYYLMREYHVAPVVTPATEDRPDFIAIPFSDTMLMYSHAVAVEIEAHADRNEQQILKNLTKPSTRDFAEIHVWVWGNEVENVIKALRAVSEPDIEKVKVFVVGTKLKTVSMLSAKEIIEKHEEFIEDEHGNVEVDGDSQEGESLPEEADTQSQHLHMDPLEPVEESGSTDLPTATETTTFDDTTNAENGSLQSVIDNLQFLPPESQKKIAELFGIPLDKIPRRDNTPNDDLLGSVSIMDEEDETPSDSFHPPETQDNPHDDQSVHNKPSTHDKSVHDHPHHDQLIRETTSQENPHKTRKVYPDVNPKLNNSRIGETIKVKNPQASTRKTRRHKEKIDPRKKNVRKFFFDDKIIVLPDGINFASFAMPREVEEAKKLLDAGYRYEIRPSNMDGVFELIIYDESGKEMWKHRGKKLSF